MLIVLAAVAGTACGNDNDDDLDDSSYSPPTTDLDDSISSSDSTSGQTSADSTVDLVSQWTIDRLNEIARIGDSPSDQLTCPSPAIFPVEVSVNSNQPIALGYCKSVFFERQPNGASVAMLVLRNDSRVPIRIGNSLLVEPAVEPGRTFKVAVPDYGPSGQWSVPYWIDTDGAAYLIANELIPQPSQIAFRNCAKDLSVGCLMGQSSQFAPEEVTVRGRRIPVRDILKALGSVVTVSSVVDRWNSLSSGADNGTIVIASP